MWIFFLKTQIAPTIERLWGIRYFQYGPLNVSRQSFTFQSPIMFR